VDYSPWPGGDYENIGVSVRGETPLREVPRCSKQFVAFEAHLNDAGLLTYQWYEGLRACYLPTGLLLSEGERFFRTHAPGLLCTQGACELCDARRAAFCRQPAT
jgi:hypothetical protein